MKKGVKSETYGFENWAPEAGRSAGSSSVHRRPKPGTHLQRVPLASLPAIWLRLSSCKWWWLASMVAACKLLQRHRLIPMLCQFNVACFTLIPVQHCVAVGGVALCQSALLPLCVCRGNYTLWQGRLVTELRNRSGWTCFKSFCVVGWFSGNTGGPAYIIINAAQVPLAYKCSV